MKELSKVLFVKGFNEVYPYISDPSRQFLIEIAAPADIHIYPALDIMEQIRKTKVIKSLSADTRIYVSCGVGEKLPIPTQYAPFIPTSKFRGAVRADFLDPYDDFKTVSWFEIFASGPTKETATANLMRNISTLPEYEYLLYAGHEEQNTLTGTYTYALYNQELLQRRSLDRIAQPYSSFNKITPIGYLTTKFIYGRDEQR